MLKVNLILLGVCFSISSQVYAELILKNVWINEAPPSATALAGYAEISNHSGEDIKLVRVESPKFSAVELHQSQIVDDMARMRRLSALHIPANQTLSLKPGGYHLMLFGKEANLNHIAGEHILLRFYFDNGEVKEHNAVIRKVMK